MYTVMDGRTVLSPTNGGKGGLPLPTASTNTGVYSPRSKTSLIDSLTDTFNYVSQRPTLAIVAFIFILLIGSVVVPFLILDYFSSSIMPTPNGSNPYLGMKSRYEINSALGLDNSISVHEQMVQLANHGHDYARHGHVQVKDEATTEQQNKNTQGVQIADTPKPVKDVSFSSSSSSNAQPDRAAVVIGAFKHAYNAYESHCMGQDDYHPLSKRCSNWINGGLTIIDALPTMMLMGPALEGEVARAREWVATKLSFSTQQGMISFFETTIRELGGLISAYDLSGDAVYLEKAKDLGNRLMPVFNTPSGFPRGQISLAGGHAQDLSWTGGSALLAEIGTCQMEFTALSQRTGDRKYADAVQKPIDVLDRLHVPNGLYPIYFNTNSGQPSNQKITWGAMGDSFYEYLLKMWLLTGRKNEQYKRMYVDSMNGMFAKLWTTNSEGYSFIADLNNGNKENKMDHLVCFAAGMLALGVEEGIVEGDQAKQHMKAAEDLMYTCWKSYDMQDSKIGPEVMTFNGPMRPGEPSYKLRPEMVESLFILYRITKDSKYRDWGWQTFQAIDRHCRVPEGGYAALIDVRQPGAREDKMESFFLAETLKYLYLLFEDDSKLVLTGKRQPGEYYVFNTECHPIKSWSA